MLAHDNFECPLENILKNSQYQSWNIVFMSSTQSNQLSYSNIYQLASMRKGGDAVLESMLYRPLSNKRLEKISDADYLAELTRKVFQSGFVWKVVDNKWSHFETAFFGFDIEKILLMPDEMLEKKATDPSIIRHLKKVFSIRDNAYMIEQAQKEYGSFAKMVANWPESDITELWLYLKKHGSRLGGNTGPYALRTLGKDTFLLTRDVEAFLREREIILGSKNSQKSLKAIQCFFNKLAEESGRSLTELSQIVAFSYGENNL